MHNSRRVITLFVGLIAAAMVAFSPAANAAPIAAKPAATHAVTHHHTAQHHKRHHHKRHHHRHHRHHHRRHHHRHHHFAGRAAMETHALHIALSKQGSPYVYGAAGPHSFDCSGLTSYAFHHAGFGGLPRTAAAQSGFAHRESRSHMRPGDLVFFYSGGHVYHVGIFDGFSHGRRIIVHSPYTGAHVRREAIWTNAWFPGTLR
jgi:cell wall-associated NlpC family hydrolase